MATNNNKLGKDGRFVLFSYLEGIAHATIVPYSMLWIFQGLGLWAFAVSAFYVSIVGIGYYFSKRHDLSGAAFFMALLVVFMIVVFFVSMPTIG